VLAAWLVPEGRGHMGQPILEIETDKTTLS
jgi:pyruvate/2-oxoglutarate dehydrogenase complex dihydrolipoamide acyltransferase (E2) component